MTSLIDHMTSSSPDLQVKDRLPDLKAIVQFTKEVTVKDPMVYDVSMTSSVFPTLIYIKSVIILLYILCCSVEADYESGNDNFRL